MDITIKIIPHGQHRYETCGDWWSDDDAGNLELRVSDMGDWRKEALVAVHELVEVLICKQRGITTEQVDVFDKAFEATREEGDEEPGDDPACPYRREYFFATSIERLLAAELGVDWAEYDKAIADL